MKKLNDALNEVHDNYIEEAAKADRLHSTAATTVRRIAVPLASAAAIAAVCLGLNSMGVFGGNASKGVDLLPANSGAADSTAITENSDFTLPQLLSMPEEIPLVLRTQEDIQGIIFGSQFPEIIYADNQKAIFTDGISGVYIYDFEAEQLTLAADILASVEQAVENYDKTAYDSWDGIHLFATSDGTICCTFAEKCLSTISSHDEYRYFLYTLDEENSALKFVENADEIENSQYDGLFELPNEPEYYQSLGLWGARIDGTEDYVYIRQSTADIDLAPEFDMQEIELRRLTEGSSPDECMDGGYYPFVVYTTSSDELTPERVDCYPENDITLDDITIVEYLETLQADNDSGVRPNFIFPLDSGTITSYFGYDEWRDNSHSGIDIAADYGSAVCAAADGTAYIPDCGNDWFGGYGNTVIIAHDGGYFTVYAHLSTALVQNGERVSQGQQIAEVGTSGWSTGAHLHFEVRAGTEAVDPIATGLAIE